MYFSMVLPIFAPFLVDMSEKRKEVITLLNIIFLKFWYSIN